MNTFDGKRVFLVLGTSTGGVGAHVASIAEGLAAADARVTVCGPSATEELFGFTAKGARFVPVEISAGLDPVADARATRRLRKALRGPGGSIAADLVHAHGMRAGLVARASRPVGVPLVVTWHNVLMAEGPKARILGAAETLVARGADLSLCVSDDLVTRVLKLGGQDVRFAPIPAPFLPETTRTADDVRAELGDSDRRRPLILAIGRLHPQKGHAVLIDAAAALADRDPKPLFVIAGEGPQRAELAERVERTGAPVRFLGHRADIADLLAAADIVASTSQWEGYPLFAQEALRSGTPLVATRVGGVPAVVGEAASLVPPDDPEAVAEAIAKLLDDPEARERLSKAGIDKAAGLPTVEDGMAQVRAVYRELTGA
ncbi:glycosyltransferase family 4 protein [Phytomonospora sp. NPDC050363]|uniref:glycosyltransferase family 4 protein n=1 Tax=Phytomonospora sp. NPDC050363 TaxID=3155642 RepID=UPI0033DBB1EF